MVNTLLLLRRRANSKDSSSKFSWPAISNLVKSETGQNFGDPNDNKETYNAFVRLVNSYPVLKPDAANPDSIVANYDGDSVTLKTHATEKPASPTKGSSSGSIMPAAKRAAASVLKRT